MVENCELKFFRVETYYGVLKLQRSVVTCINPWSGIRTCRKYKWYLSAPLSGSALDNTCIWIDLDLLKPSIDKTTGCLTVIVPPRKTLSKILSSTWVVE